MATLLVAVGEEAAGEVLKHLGDQEIEVVIEAVEQHNPVIRNNLLMLVGGADLATLSTREGKEALRARALAEVQAVVEAQTGEKGVEDLYFTSFVVQ